MASTLLLAFGLLAAAPEPAANPADLAAYGAANAAVGRDAASHIRLAFWCEAHGLKAERDKHLALAVLAEPGNAAARGLMGLVSFGNQWKRPEAVAEKVKADEALAARLAEYNARREKTPTTADAHAKLARWCEQNGLDAEARAHFATVVRLDPGRDDAWKRLGCKKVGGRWVTEAQAAADKEEAEARKKADRHWKPLLTKWRGMLGDKTKRDAAEEALAGVADPRAVPSVLAVFVAAGEKHHERAVRLLGQIDAPASSQALAMLAVFNTSAEVRRAATETLKRRDPREFAGMLVALLRKPVKYEVRPVGGPGSPGALFVEGERFNVRRLYSPPPARLVIPGGGTFGYDSQNGPTLFYSSQFNQQVVGNVPWTQFNKNLPQYVAQADARGLNLLTGSGSLPSPLADVINRNQQQTFDGQVAGFRQQVRQSAAVHAPNQSTALGLQLQTTSTVAIPLARAMQQAQQEAVQTAVLAQQILQSDVDAIEAQNAASRDANNQIAQVLNNATGQTLPADPETWTSWFVDQIGYRYTGPSPPTATVEENVLLPSSLTMAMPQAVGVGQSLVLSRVSCFGAGTLVRTLDGSRPIELIRVGDRVLTQDVKTGALGYQPVTVVHHNPPSATFLIKANGETIVSSPFHRFWVAGRGWVMARDLTGGEPLRFLDGPARVESVEAGAVQPVFNLDVADAHDFFAGAAGALVHDNTVPDTRIDPFDAPPR